MTGDQFENGLNPINKRPNKEVYEETLARDELIRKHPQVSKHHVMWSHDWERMIKRKPFVKSFVEIIMAKFCPNQVEKEFSWQRCLKLILEKKIHG